ncbi:MAG: NTP transferase domain-containing protein [Candidatus Omnitrophica bacterium]|nr:NTP transferase domain-containing protein [Candidatus Omnitrophota bacterium]
MQVVILAGGLGTRLRPLTNRLPKVLVRVQGKPFLQYQLSWLARHGLRDVVLCVGHRAAQIQAFAKDGRAFGMRIAYAQEGRRLLGTAGALKHAAALLDERFCVLNGDSYLPINPMEPITYFLRRDLTALMVAFKNRGRYGRSNAKVRGGFVTLYTRQGRVPGLDTIDYGLRIFRKSVLRLIPSKTFCDMDTLYERLIARDALASYMVAEPFYEVGAPPGLARFERYVERTGLAR